MGNAIKLKLKYKLNKPGIVHKTGAMNSGEGARTGLAAVMSKKNGNDHARNAHFLDCAANGWFEQIPLGRRQYYANLVGKELT